MPRFIAVLQIVVLLVAGFPASAFADDIPDQTAAKVEKIESGDVIVVKLAASKKRVKVRVLGIDCSKSAKNAAASLVGRESVSLRSDKGFLPIAQDQLGRYVAYVEMQDGRDFGLEMLKSGECTTEDWKFPHPRLTQYASASR